MIKYVYCLKDKSQGFFENPIFRNDDKEHVKEEYIRSLATISDDQTKLRVRDKALYFLGTYDDKVPSISMLNNPEKLVDFEDYIHVGNKEGN